MSATDKSRTPSPPDRTKEILVDFLDEELLQARDALRRSRTFGIILTAIVAVYMTFLARGIGQYLEPEEAARLTTIFVADQVQNKSELLADEIKTGVPGMIKKLPDHFLSEIPRYRKGLEDRVIENSEQHMRTTIESLDLDLAEFLQSHQGDVKSLLVAKDQLDVAEAFNDAIFEHLMNFLTTVPSSGESFSQRLKRSLDILKVAEERIDFLALNQNLSRPEQKTRYALAILSQSIADQMHAMKMRIKAAD